MTTESADAAALNERGGGSMIIGAHSGSRGMRG